MLKEFVNLKTKQVSIHALALVARGRFELPSAGPEPAMIDRYTTGLNVLVCYRKVFSH